MKISLNWLKEYIDISETPEQLADLLTQTGLEVEGFEKIEKIPGGLEGVVIGEVMECAKHPDADKLKVTKVDIGQPEFAPIVCGAPNVAVGQKVVVATVNSTIYPKGHDPIKIKKAKIRGEVSEGMICAEDELGIGTSHAGIMILDTKLPNGTPAAAYFKPEVDWVYEIGLTPNRGDAASHWGTARDIRAVTGGTMRFPTVKPLVIKVDRPVAVEVKDAEGAPRYSGLTIRDIEVKDSPEWLKWRLRAIDLEPISNIVDVTNYLCHGLGQPMHAFDADVIKGGKVVVRTMPNGSDFTTLDEKERKLHEKDLMICDTEDGMCIGGVFGGINSGIKDTTKNIFLESAYFSPEYIRNTVQRHGVTTDASFRFERGADPEMTVKALEYATQLILEVAGGYVASNVVDIYATIVPARIQTTFQNFHRLIGKELEHGKITSILESLDIVCVDVTETGFTAVVPSYRNDVTRQADLVEEVLRIYGFNNIELDDYSSTSYLAEFAENEPYVIKRQLGHFLSGRGYHEILTNSLVHPDYSGKLKVNDLEAIEILNKSSEELAFMKTSPVHAGLEVVRHNLNRRMPNIQLFEWSKTYHRDGEKHVETPYLCLYLTGDIAEESWLRETNKAIFQDLMGVILSTLKSLRINQIGHEAEAADKLFATSMKLNIGGGYLGRAGVLQPSLLKHFDIKQPIFYAELNWDRIMRNVGGKFQFEELPKFPEVRRDLSLVLDKGISFDRIEEIAFKSAKKLLTRVNVFSVYEGDKMEAGKKSYAVSYYLQDKTKTLNDKLIEQVMNGLMKSYENELGAIIRK
jgi:phenylalanyl-tRNA synthetase beta chain